MKTKELIRRLQEADPTGEEVSVGNTDILYIRKMPSYYDDYRLVVQKELLKMRDEEITLKEEFNDKL